MTDSEIDKKFSRFWTKGYYVLVKSAVYIGYTIQDEETGMTTIIEEDKIASYVVDRMIKNGCKIYESIQDLPKPTLRNRWDSMEEWLFFTKIAKEFNLDSEEADQVARYIPQNANREAIIKLIKQHITRCK
jgi:hypothetical protein